MRPTEDNMAGLPCNCPNGKHTGDCDIDNYVYDELGELISEDLEK